MLTSLNTKSTDYYLKLLETKKAMTPQKTPQKTTQKVLDAIRLNPHISRVELASISGITEDGIKYQLNALKKKGLIKRVGPDRGGYWEIAKKQANLPITK